MKVGDHETLDIATGGNAVRALSASMMRFANAAHVYSTTVAHDTGCPRTGGPGGLAACTCEILEVTVRRIQ